MVLQNDDFLFLTESVDTKDVLLNSLSDYCKAQECQTFFVSLSGGVDSMVIASIIKYLKYDVKCIHINYNNRDESVKEAEFLKLWCEKNKIELIYKNIVDFKRKDKGRKYYEEQTRIIRFNLYKQVLKDFEKGSIILGHHDDDIIENVFNNICKGGFLLNLKVMNKTSVISGVNISRPLMGFRKSDIYYFANKYKVAFFKDTTPPWSVRGKFRTTFSPELSKTYCGFNENLLYISEQSEEWSTLVNEHILIPFLNEVTYNPKSITIKNIEKYKKFPECFWRHVVSVIFKKKNEPQPTLKSIKNMYSSFEKKGKITLTKNATACVDDISFVIVFK